MIRPAVKDLALHRQLKMLTRLTVSTAWSRLGSQGVWCPHPRLVMGLFEAFGRPLPHSFELNIYINNTGRGLASSRRLQEDLSFKYYCVDIDDNFGSLTMDLNFDPGAARVVQQVRPDHQSWD